MANTHSKRERSMIRIRGWRNGAAAAARTPEMTGDEDYEIGYIAGMAARSSFQRKIDRELRITPTERMRWLLR